MIRLLFLSVLLIVGSTTFAGNEDFAGSWESKSEKASLRMKIRVDQNDLIAYLYNEAGETFMMSGLIKDAEAKVTIRDANHFAICDATITLNNGHLELKAKGSTNPKDTGIPKESIFTKEY